MALLETLNDEFDGTTLNAAKWTNASQNGGVVTIGGGLATFTTTTASVSRARIESTGAYTITSSSVIIEVGALDPDVVFYFIVANTAGSGQAQLYYRGTLGQMWLVATNAAAGTAYNAASIGAYTAAAWKYIRLRFGATSACTVDRSTDGITWTAVATTGALNFANGQLRLFGQTSGVATTSTIEGVSPSSAYLGTTAVDNITDTDDIGLPDLAFTTTATPDAINDPDSIDGPTVAAPPAPTSITDTETVGAPTAANITVVAPDGITDVDTTGTPVVSRWPLPDGITDNTAIGTPDVQFTPSHLYPGSIIDVGPIGAPTATVTSYYIGGYGQGPYGGGLYSGSWISPNPIGDPETVGQPASDVFPAATPDSIEDPETLTGPALSGDPVGLDIRPLSIIDAETLDDTPVSFYGSDLYGQGLYGQGLYGRGQVGEADPHDPTIPDPTNYLYGAGTYNEGPYYGLVNAPTDTNPADNLTYGTGTYNWGIYYGTVVSVVDAQPLFAPTVGYTLPALHILGVGPWSPVIQWRGASNYQVPGGNRPSRPVMALPAATSKGFTLRLNEGSEARAELNLPRGAAVLIDEMDTDLWWRRKDPRTKLLEVIGRFNTSHVNMSTSDTGVAVSLQFDDYQTVLQDRLVLRYLHPTAKPNPESAWDKGTKVTDILAFAIPANTRLDLSEVTGATPYPLGTITQPYHLAPGTTIGDVFDQLNAISPIRWEWWIETPADIDAAPKLRFQIGNRGTDKGVVLHDLGKGPSPIASWTRNGAADNYANTLLYMGSDGGVLETIDAQILQYGQRDTQASYPLNGTQMPLLRAAAKRKLEKLADRRPTYTITLAAGFWRGRHHIDIGDTVTLLIRLGKERIHEKYRVSEITVEIDDVGAEDVTVTLGTPLASADARSKRSPIMRLVRTLKNYNVPAGAKEIQLETE